ncbi:hypothetical protein AB0M35_28945 [Micromonospora sp. NPDC051196]
MEATAPFHHADGNLLEPFVQDRCGAALATLGFGLAACRRREPGLN